MRERERERERLNDRVYYELIYKLERATVPIFVPFKSGHPHIMKDTPGSGNKDTSELRTPHRQTIQSGPTVS